MPDIHREQGNRKNLPPFSSLQEEEMIIEVAKFRIFIGPAFLPLPVDMKMVLSLDIYIAM